MDVDLDNLFGDIPKTKAKPKRIEESKDDAPKSRAFSNVDFLQFPRPKIEKPNASKPVNSEPLRKRQKIVPANQTIRKRKVCALNVDKLSKMMNAKTDKSKKRGGVKLLSIQQKRQMREDSNRREQERRILLEQQRVESERLKRMERQKIEREEKEKRIENDNDDQDESFDDFDAFMNNASTAQNEQKMDVTTTPTTLVRAASASSSASDNDSMCDLDLLIAPNTEVKVEKMSEAELETQRLIALGIPEALHRFAWLHTNCNALTQPNRERIVLFMTGQYSVDNVEKEDVLLNRMVDDTKGITKDTVFRMMFATKKWKKVILSKRIKKKVT